MLKRKVIFSITFLIISYLVFSGGRYLSKPLGYSLFALAAIISSISLYKFVKEKEHGWISPTKAKSKTTILILQILNYIGVLIASALALGIIFNTFNWVVSIIVLIINSLKRVISI